MLVLLAAIWGSSFMFIKVADRRLHPETLVFGRLAFAVVTLGVVLVVRGRVREAAYAFRAHAGPLVLASLLNVAIPFWLLAWGETRVDSGPAALFQASAPIFTAVFALFFARAERVTGLRLLGVLVGFAGSRCSSARRPEARFSGRSPASPRVRSTRPRPCTPVGASRTSRP